MNLCGPLPKPVGAFESNEPSVSHYSPGDTGVHEFGVAAATSAEALEEENIDLTNVTKGLIDI